MGKKSILMKEEEEKNIVYALIWSAKIFALQSCWRVFVQLKIRAFNSLLYRYLFEGCYFGAIMGSAKIAKIKYL